MRYRDYGGLIEFRNKLNNNIIMCIEELWKDCGLGIHEGLERDNSCGVCDLKEEEDKEDLIAQLFRRIEGIERYLNKHIKGDKKCN